MSSTILSRIDDLAAQADELHSKHGYNCAQAVACTLAPEVGIDADTAYTLSEGFGAGMGGRTETCGAISGGIMALGQLSSGGRGASGTTKARTYRMSKELAERFREQNGSTLCCELKGIGCEHGPLRSCAGCIEDAMRITADIIARFDAE